MSLLTTCAIEYGKRNLTTAAEMTSYIKSITNKTYVVFNKP